MTPRPRRGVASAGASPTGALRKGHKWGLGLGAPSMIALKNYQQGLQRLLAACDEELLGTRHEEGQFQLEVHEGFYDGVRVDEEGLAHHLRQCTVANLVGDRSVAVAIELGLVAESNVLTIQGVRHAQLLVYEE